MADWILNLKANGVEPFAGDLQKLVDQFNKQEAAARSAAKAQEQSAQRAAQAHKRYAAELAAVDQQRAQRKFREMTTEKQLAVLSERLGQVRRISANVQNETARIGLLAKQRQLEEQILGISRQRVAAAKQLDEQLRSQTRNQLRQQHQRPGGSGAGGAAEAGGLRTRLVSGLRSGLQGLGGILGIAGAASIVAGGRAQIDYAAQIRDRAKAFNMGTEQLQQFEYAGNQSGANLQDITDGFKGLVRAQGAAMEGQTRYIAMFERFGISIDDLRSKRPEDIFLHVAKRVQEGTGSAQEMSDVMGVLGETAFEKLVPAFRSGFSSMAQHALDAGAVIEDRLVKSLAASGDELTTLQKQMGTFFAQLTDWAAKGGLAVARRVQDTAAFWGAVSGGASLAEAARIAEAQNVQPKAPSPPPDQATPDIPAVVPAEVQRRMRLPGGESVPASDALSRIGLFRGSDPVQPLLKQQATELRSIHMELQRINRTLTAE